MARPESISTLEEARQYRREQAVKLISGETDRVELREDPNYLQARRLIVFDRWKKLAQNTPEVSEDTWEKSAGVLSGGCNNGVKACLWIEIAQTAPGTYISVDDLYQRYRNIFAGTKLLEASDKYRNAKCLMVGYCQDSLCDVGLVAAKHNLAGKVIGFGITPDGQKYLDAAYLTLWWENQYNQSLYSLLGITSSPGDSRSPLNRVRILDYLMRHPHQVQEIDLLNIPKLGAHSTGITLNLFNQLGLVEYKNITPHTQKNPLQYESVACKNLYEAGYVSTAHALQDKVIQAIVQLTKNSPAFSMNDIVSMLPDELKERWLTRHLVKHISKILSGFAREGLLTRVNDFKGRGKQSDASITQAGRSFVLEFAWAMMEIIEGRQLTEEQIARISLAKKELDRFSQNSCELYYPYSTSAKMLTKKEHIVKVVELLAGSERPLNANELAERIGGISAKTVHNYLRPQAKESDGILIKFDDQQAMIYVEKVKGVNYYSIKPPNLD